MLLSARTLSDWKAYLLELVTTGAIQSGLVAAIGGADFVKTFDWTYSRQELDDLVPVVTAASSSSATTQQRQPNEPVSSSAVVASSSIRIQGEEFHIVRRYDDMVVAVSHVDAAAVRSSSLKKRSPMIAAVGRSKKFLVAAVVKDDGTTDAVSSRCSKEVQWITERMIADGL